jgi:RNA polymerase sigma-70 factor (ECF subfamily)
MAVHLENETALVAQAQTGDNGAFTELVKLYDRHIYRLALNITRNPEDAKDVLQESLLKAYANLDRFEGNSRFYTWLVRIAINEALMKLRRSRAEKELSLDEVLVADDGSFMPREIEDWGENPEERYSKTELQEILANAIENLKLPYRVVFQLRDVDGLSIEETAQALGLSTAAVKSRLLRARLQLRETLNPYFQKRLDHGL